MRGSYKPLLPLGGNYYGGGSASGRGILFLAASTNEVAVAAPSPHRRLPTPPPPPTRAIGPRLLQVVNLFGVVQKQDWICFVLLFMHYLWVKCLISYPVTILLQKRCVVIRFPAAKRPKADARTAYEDED